jgi:hypothetical protein
MRERDIAGSEHVEYLLYVQYCPGVGDQLGLQDHLGAPLANLFLRMEEWENGTA